MCNRWGGISNRWLAIKIAWESEYICTGRYYTVYILSKS